MTASYEMEAEATCSLSLIIRVATNNLEDLSKAVIMLTEDAVESFGKYISDENYIFISERFEDNAENYQLVNHSKNIYDVIINEDVLIYCTFSVEASSKRKAVSLSLTPISYLRVDFSVSRFSASMGADFPMIPQESALFSRGCKLASLWIVPYQAATKASGPETSWCVPWFVVPQGITGGDRAVQSV